MNLRTYQHEISNKAVDLLHEFGIAYLSMQVRTGKTITALNTAKLYGAKNVLFVTKKKAIPSIEADYGHFAEHFAISIINYEQLHNYTGKPDLVIIDEAHSLGQYPLPSERTKALKELCKALPIIYLSGTPSPESYSQLYHQFWVSSNSPFADPTFYKIGRAHV
jgi:superfamily II DNA or RNA helicase